MPTTGVIDTCVVGSTLTSSEMSQMHPDMIIYGTITEIRLVTPAKHYTMILNLALKSDDTSMITPWDDNALEQQQVS
jgi:hypothetical protein